jgi:hypothetical protein
VSAWQLQRLHNSLEVFALPWQYLLRYSVSFHMQDQIQAMNNIILYVICLALFSFCSNFLLPLVRRRPCSLSVDAGCSFLHFSKRRRRFLSDETLSHVECCARAA